MHTSGDDTDDEVEPSPMYMEVDPVASVESIPPGNPAASVESVAMEEIVRQVVGLQNIPVPNRKREE